VLEGSLRIVLCNIGDFFQGFSAPPRNKITLCRDFELGNFVGLFDWSVGRTNQVTN
jgi:hypothetical protein